MVIRMLTHRFTDRQTNGLAQIHKEFPEKYIHIILDHMSRYVIAWDDSALSSINLPMPSALFSPKINHTFKLFISGFNN